MHADSGTTVVGGEAGHLVKLSDLRVALVEPAGAVELGHDELASRQAQVGPAYYTVLAPSAGGHEGDYDAVARGNRGNTLAYFFHRACSLVAEDYGEGAFGISVHEV